MNELNINKLELPEFDIVLAVPICIPLRDDKKLFFELPNVEDYFKFEAHYLKILTKYFTVLANVSFLEYREFADLKLVEELYMKLRPLMQIEGFKKDFIKIIKLYFTANFKIGRKLDFVNPPQLTYLFLFIHKVVEMVKKKFTAVAILDRASNQMSGIFSSSSNPNSTRIAPRF